MLWGEMELLERVEDLGFDYTEASLKGVFKEFCMFSHREIVPATPPVTEETLSGPRPKKSPVSGAKCTQCGNVIRHMPVFLQNITCRDCYGLDRYKRGETSMIGAGRKVPEPAAEIAPESTPSNR